MEATVEKLLGLYQAHRERLEAAPELLAKARPEAKVLLESQGLPPFRSEDYQRTNLTSFFEGIDCLPLGGKEFAPPTELPKKHCSLKGLEMQQLAMLDGAIPKELSRSTDRSFIGSLRQFALEHPELLSAYLEHMPKRKDALLALNQLFLEDGLVVYLAAGEKLSAHQLQQFTTQEGALICRRLLFILEEGAEAEWLICDHNHLPQSSLNLEVISVYLAKGARLTLNLLEDSTAMARRISVLEGAVEAGAALDVANITISGGKTRNNFYCDLLGSEADLHLSGLVVASGKQHTDNYSLIQHLVPNCTSQELFKYTLSDESYGVFTGKIYVAQDAQKTEAYQNNRNLLLSPQARMQSKPQLEIYADDVKCSHGMTTGQLDEDALFYMRQRGIPESEARRLLSIAFSEDVLAEILNEALRDRIREIVSARFSERSDVSSCCHCHS